MEFCIIYNPWLHKFQAWFRKTGSNIRGMHVLVQLVGIGDAGLVERLRSADQSPQCRAIGLSYNVSWNTISASVPAGRNLSSNRATEFEGLGNEDPGALLEFYEPLVTLTRPDITFITMFVFELLGLDTRYFNRL